MAFKKSVEGQGKQNFPAQGDSNTGQAFTELKDSNHKSNQR